MIDFDVTMQPNSIEELFAKKFEELSKYPMDNNTSEIFVKLLLSRRNSEEIKLDVYLERLIKKIKKRFKK